MKSSILLKEEIVKASNNIRKKFNMLRHESNDVEQLLDTTFKPITTPLNTLVHQQIENIAAVKTEKDDRAVKHEKNIEQDDGGEPIDDDDDDDIENTDLYEIVKNYLHNLVSSSSNHNEMDLTYGIRLVHNQLQMGSVIVKFAANGDLKVNNELFNGTPGLYELIFLKKPSVYDASDLPNYKKLLIETNAFRKNHNPLGGINGNRGYKYTHIISNLLSTPKMGHGLLPKRMKLSSLKSEYVYWDDVNELVDRLRLLFSSRSAGHNGHDNEILSIIEELRESNIIK